MARWTASRMLLVAGCACTVAACSLATDVSGLTGGAAVVAPDASDAGTSPNDGGGIPDAPSSGDARTDSGPPLRLCELAQHAFCTDFDSDDLSKGWTGTIVDGMATIALSDAHAVSFPRGMHVLMPRRAAGDALGYAKVDKVFASPWRRVVVELDVFLEAPDWMAGDINAGVVGIEFFSDTTSEGVYLSAGQSYTNLKDSSANALPPSQWTHVKIDVDYPSGKITGSAGSQPYATTLTPQAAGANPRIAVGVGVFGYNQPAPQFSLWYDNVVIDLP